MAINKHALCYLILCSSLLLNAADANTFLYVALPDENEIALYRISDSDGALEKVGVTELPSDPGPLSVSHDRSTIYASLRTAGRIASFRTDKESGDLTLLNIVDVDQDPAYHWQDRTGRWLLSAYYATGRVAVHGLNDDGSFDTSVKPRWYSTADKAHSIEGDNANRTVLVPHTGPNKIFQFEFDSEAGVLELKDGGVLNTGEMTGPRHIQFHKRGRWVYTDYEQGNAIAVMSHKNGLLATKQIVPSVPDTWTGGGACAQMLLSPDSRFLYVANRGHNSIAGFSINKRDGIVSPIGYFATEANPRSFAIHPNGKWLYAGGQDTGKLAIFDRNRDDGTLLKRETVESGKRPWWLQLVDYGN